MSLSAVWPRLRFWGLVLVALYVLLLILVWVFQRKLIYFPDARPVALPEGAEWERAQALALKTSDGIALQAWYLPGRLPGTVLIFHGNAGNRAGRRFYAEGFHRLGYGVLLPDYRGYGGSEGEPSEAGLYLDAECCRTWLSEKVPGPIVYLGSSIGGGVACELARRHPPAGLVLQSVFSSLPDVAQAAYPYLPARWLLRDRFENADKVATLSCPLLMFHGEADRIVPPHFAQRVYDAAPDPKEWVGIAGAGHNDLVGVAGERYWTAVDRFLKSCLNR